MEYKKIIAEEMSKHINVDVKIIEELIEIPQKAELGDYVFPCFKINKFLNKTPNYIAMDLKDKLKITEFEKIEVFGAYINFFVNKEKFIKGTIEQILLQGDKYGVTETFKGKNIIIQFDFEDFYDKFTINNLLTLTIGNLLYNVLSHVGYNCICINNSKDIYNTLNSITRFHEIFTEIWLNLKFNSVVKENLNNKNEVIEKLYSKNLVSISNGIKIVNLKKFNMSPCIIENFNGDLNQVISDISNYIYLKSKYTNFKKICIANNERKGYYDKILAVLNLMQEDCNNNFIKLHTGNIVFKQQTLSNKKNNINELISELLLFEKSMSDKDECRFVGNEFLKVMILHMLRENIGRNFSIDIEKMFDFSEKTLGSKKYSYYKVQEYIMKVNNTIAENNTIIEKNKEIDYTKIVAQQEFELMMILNNFQNIIIKAAQKLEVNIIIEYLLEIINAFNKIEGIYDIKNINDENLKYSKIKIIQATCQVIKNTLKLIGI